MAAKTQTWDIFCRVIDNYGDAGVCWRLAQQLAAEFDLSVRLWIDELAPLGQLCPAIRPQLRRQSVAGVVVGHWTADFPAVVPADVVIEAFACQIPETYIAAMSARDTPSIWINLEYLSAEAWVESCHGLPSPQASPSLRKFFFFPGFTAKTGGLLREQHLLAQRAAFGPGDAAVLWSALNLPAPAPHEARVSLFCYENPALPALLQRWSNQARPLTLLATPGPACQQTAAWWGQPMVEGTSVQRGALTVVALPFLTQLTYDRLLWSCDLNFVRGEDSFVRAQWAQQPLVWQIYPQAEQAHLVKLEAFLDKYLQHAPQAMAQRQFWQAWNGQGDLATAWDNWEPVWPKLGQFAKDWAGQLDRVGHLADNLRMFVQEALH